MNYPSKKTIHDAIRAAEKLCKIYFEIAAEAIGEKAVRAKRDAMIEKELKDNDKSK